MVRGNEHPGLNDFRRKNKKSAGWTKHSREHAMAARGITTRDDQPKRLYGITQNPVGIKHKGHFIYKDFFKGDELVAVPINKDGTLDWENWFYVVNSEMDELVPMFEDKLDDLWEAHGIPGISEIDNPRSFGTALKRYMKDKYGIKIWTRSIKSVRPFDQQFYDIVVDWREGETIPNEFRQEIIEKIMPYAKITNWDNINYGNIRSTYVTLTVEEWKKLLEE